MIDHLFDTTTDNAHLVQVDSFEAAEPQRDKIRHGQFASEKQLNFLKSLFAERTGNEEAMILRTHLLSEYKAGKLSTKMASEAITDLLAMPKSVQNSVQSSVQNAEHGEVWLTASGQIVRVKLSNSSGNLYGLVWTGSQWDYTPGIMHQLDHKMTAEEAAAFGHEHQWCVFCSRPLSDPRSEYAGYGETCARNRGLPWGAVADVDDLPDREPYRPNAAVYATVSEEWFDHLRPEPLEEIISAPSTEDIIEYPYGEGTCRVCLQPRPYVLNGYLRGCDC